AELNLNGTGRIAPATTAQNDGALRFEGSSGFAVNTTFNNAINLQSDSHINVAAADAVGLLTQLVHGVGKLQKTGGGTLALKFANTYTGGTDISNGSLLVDGASATLGAGDVMVEGANLGTALKLNAGVLNAIADAATLNLAGGGTAGVADQGYVDLGV